MDGSFRDLPLCFATIENRVVDYTASSLTFQAVSRGAAAKALYDRLPSGTEVRQFSMKNTHLPTHSGVPDSSIVVSCRPDGDDAVCERVMIRPPAWVW
jgi:hypothetical protein